MKKIFLCALAVTALFVSCSKSEKPAPVAADVKEENVTASTPTQEEQKGVYTYRTISSSPSTWNPTDWSMGNEGTVLDFTASGLYDFVMNETKDGYEVFCEMAAELPADVTKEYAGNEKYGIPAGAESGYAWKYNLIQNAVWEDGTKINADTYEYTFKQFLNPDMKNLRSSSFCQDNFAIANAYDYYSGKEGVEWSDVGFIKNDEFSFTLILKNSLSPFFVQYNSTSIIPVHPKLYEENKSKKGQIVKSSYGTSPEKYSSCGPYRISEFQPDKEMKFERNEKWYGWTDNKHEGQYAVTNIQLSYISEHSTALSLFLRGELDDVALDVNDLKVYGNSEYRLTTPESYTWKYSFNIDKEALKKHESKGINKSILSYTDFRHGISLALDRQKYVDTITPASDVGFGLINYMYVADPESGELYRNTPQAQKVLCDLYLSDKVENITGYNPEAASFYITKAYKAALAAGDISEGDVVQIDYHTYDTNTANMRSVAFLEDALKAVAVKTPLEGRIVVKQVTDENYYENMRRGRVDCAMTGWGGAAYDPYGIMWCYCDPGALNEYGFDPESEMLEIDLSEFAETGGLKIQKSFYDWYRALCEGEYSSAESSVRNTILSQMEKGLLSYYNMIPIRYLNSTELISQRTVMGSETFVNSLVGYGGIRFMSFSMDDAEWDKYCDENNRQLKY